MERVDLLNPKHIREGAVVIVARTDKSHHIPNIGFLRWICLMEMQD